jgi:hypothetical protein
MGGGDLRKPCLKAIPAFDCIAGLYNRNLSSNRGICLRYRLKVRLRVLTDLTKDYCLGGTEIIMGGINFGWLAV